MAALSALPFPQAPDDPDLAAWILDLSEADGYYAGLATTALAGGRVSPSRQPIIQELEEWLAQVRVASPEDEAVLKQCWSYLEALRHVEEKLQA